MKPILTFLTGACCTLLLVSHTWALQPAEGSPCESNIDCPEGQICEMSDCPAIDCDPDDPDCEQPACPQEGTCVDGGDNGWESSCETDADCPAGFECDVIGGVSEACAAGADCPEPETTLIYGCKPASCDTDADCAGDLVCITYEVGCDDITVSAVPDCAGEDCPPAEEPPSCEPTTEGVCGPKWAAPCEEAADCGEGFQCVAEVVDNCGEVPISSDGAVPMPAPAPDTPDEDSDSSDGEDGQDEGSSEGSAGDGATPADPEEGEGDPEEDCEPENTGVMICEPIAVACNTDADCAIEGWTCQLIGTVSVAAVPCPADDPDCDPTPEPEDSSVTEGMCVPPGWDTYGGGGPGGVLSDKGTEENAETNNDGQEQGAPTNSDSQAGATSTDDGGCNAGKSQGGLVLALFALFLVVLTRRREVVQS